jgi:hypothetical protein
MQLQHERSTAVDLRSPSSVRCSTIAMEPSLTATSMRNVPADVICLILGHFGMEELLPLRLVCRSWRLRVAQVSVDLQVRSSSRRCLLRQRLLCGHADRKSREWVNTCVMKGTLEKMGNTEPERRRRFRSALRRNRLALVLRLLRARGRTVFAVADKKRRGAGVQLRIPEQRPLRIRELESLRRVFPKLRSLHFPSHRNWSDDLIPAVLWHICLYVGVL